VVERVNLDGMTVEDSYDGPRLENETTVTLEFMEALLAAYRDQKKLHRRYAFQMLLDVRKYFSAQPTLVDVPVPADTKFTICGDIHGQVIFRTNPNQTQ
jgi:serine/threonine-protein phosphatase 5